MAARLTLSQQAQVPTCNQCAWECGVLEVGRVSQHAEGLLLQQQDTGCWLCTMMSQDRWT